MQIKLYNCVGISLYFYIYSTINKYYFGVRNVNEIDDNFLRKSVSVAATSFKLE